MTDSYYLISSKYKHFCVGTIFRYDGKKLYDIQVKSDFKFTESIPSDWILISNHEAKFLLNNSVLERVNLKKQELFTRISKLEINERCHYVVNKIEYSGIIMAKSLLKDSLNFRVKSEFGVMQTVEAHQIKLLDVPIELGTKGDNTNRPSTSSSTARSLDTISIGNPDRKPITVTDLRNSAAPRLGGNDHSNSVSLRRPSDDVGTPPRNTPHIANPDSLNLDSNIVVSPNEATTESTSCADNRESDGASSIYYSLTSNVPSPSSSYRSTNQGTDNNGTVIQSSVIQGSEVEDSDEGTTVIETPAQKSNKQVPNIEFVNGIYLRKGYLLDNIPKEHNERDVDKIFQVKNNSSVRGKYKFSVTLLNEKLTVLEIDQKLTENTNDSLEEVYYIDNIVKGKTAVIVKVESTQLFVDTLKYLRNGSIVDFNSVRKHDIYRSELFRNNDPVSFQVTNEEHHGIIIDTQLLNNIKCAHVWDLTNSTTIYILEGALTKLPTNTVINSIETNGEYARQIGNDNIEEERMSLQQSSNVATVSDHSHLSKTVSDEEIKIDSPKLDEVEKVYFFKNTYFNDDIDINIAGGTANAGKLVCIKDNHDIYGQCVSAIKWKDEVLHIIEINNDYLRDHLDLFEDIRLYPNHNGVSSIIVVKKEAVTEFKGPIKFLRDGKIIDMNSINFREQYKSPLFNEGDIVKFDHLGGIFYGSIGNFETLNYVKCVSVINCNEICGSGHQVVFVREEDVTKVYDTELRSNYYQDIIIVPDSIKSLTTLSRDHDIKIDDIVQCTLKDTRCCLEGTVRQIVNVNNEISVIVELLRPISNVELGQYKINNIRPYQDKFAFINDAFIIKRSSAVKKIEYFFCERNQVHILNPANVESCSEWFEENKVIVFKDNGRTVWTKLLWRGFINDRPFIGCELLQETQYGTNGLFGVQKKLFDCADGRGVLIPLDKIEGCCVNGTHRQLSTSRDGRVIGSSICCAKKMEQLSRNLKMNVNDKIKNRNTVSGTCRWIGRLNDVEIIGLEPERRHEEWQDRGVENLSLFDNTLKPLVMFKADEFKIDEEFYFFKKIYLNKEIDLKTMNKSAGSQKLVTVKDQESVYGRESFTIMWMNEKIIAVRINCDYFTAHFGLFKDIKVYSLSGSTNRLILVRSSAVKDFDEPLQYVNLSVVVDLHSVKIREHCESKNLKLGDVVTYKNGDGKEGCHGRVVKFELLNDICCVSVMKAINLTMDVDEKYIREDAVTKVREDAMRTRYYEDTVIDPRSIVTLTRSHDPDLDVDDEVEFTLGNRRSKCDGVVRLIVNVNGTTSAIVELINCRDEQEIKKYAINNEEYLKNILKSTRTTVIVKATPVTRKKYLFCGRNKLSILNPVNVDCFDDFSPEDRTIIFKSKGETVFMKLLLRVQIDNHPYIGCELFRETPFGTNGQFGKSKLFECPAGKGVLIPLDKIEECCDNGEHKQLEKLSDGRIVGSSICCARRVTNLRNRSDLKLGERLMAISDSGHMHVTCHWLGLLNNSEVVAVEMDKVHDEWFDEYLEKLNLFDNSMHKIAMFIPDEFYPVDPINFYKNIFFKNDIVPTTVIQVKDSGNLVRVQGHQGTYGRLLFKTFWKEIKLIAIEIDEEYLQTHVDIFRPIKLYMNDKNVQSVIMAKSIYVKEFKEPLEFVRGSGVVDMNSVRLPERCEPRNLKKNDLVKYDNVTGICYGRIETVKLLNDIRCIGVLNSIEVPGDHGLVYVKENVATKVIVDESTLTYFQDTVIDPRSIMEMKPSLEALVNVDDEVDFTLQDTHERFDGRVLLIVEIHGVLSVVVELSGVVNAELSKYTINSIPHFQDAFKSEKPTVIVKSTIVRQKFLFCPRNKVSVFNPLCVNNIEDQNNDNTMITFKSNGENVFAKMLWRGKVYKETMIGCELMNTSQYGTDGRFGQTSLFHCNEGKGVLIRLDKIEDCCVNGEHRQLEVADDGRIIGSSICCVKSVTVLNDKEDIRVGSKVKTFGKNGKVFGICRWIGLVNNNETIGMIMTTCYNFTDDIVTQLLSHEDMRLEHVTLFKSDDLIADSVGHGYCYKNNVCFLDTRGIYFVDNGCTMNKKMKYRYDDQDVIINIRWKGEINGESCLGCELKYECECGDIDGQPLFEYTRGKGAFVPVIGLEDSCEYTKYLIDIGELIVDDGSGHHKRPDLNQCGSINPASICCVDTLGVLNDRHSLEIGSKLKFKREFRIGNCKWIGLVNGFPSIGAKMKDDTNDPTGHGFSGFEIFTCKNDRGMIFLADDIYHDAEKEKLPFLVDKIVNVENLWKVKANARQGIQEMNLGDYVQTKLSVGDTDLILKGELKWIGMINKVECVGLDLEVECAYGMDGPIKDNHRFDYLPRHGIVTTMENIKKCDEILDVSYLEDGLIDPEKYMICVEEENEYILRERNVTKNGKTCVIIDNEGDKLKRTGILRWSGTMNRVAVAVVELEKEYKNGTNGRFWRHRLIQCGTGKAVAVLWENVHEYFPYEKKEIPIDKRLFKEISNNSAVVYYHAQGETRQPIYGTVKWSGIDENGEYLYGIELDDRCIDGTDGKFQGQKLFDCQNRCGVLVPMDEVAPDVRFLVLEQNDEDIPESEDSEVCEYAIPTKRFVGENFGIQGNKNSCYFDSSLFALFSKSDVLDFMISGLINEKEDVDITKQFRGMMASKIVWPLRKSGTVSFHKTRDMRDVIKEYGTKFLEMTKQETDMENVAALLSKLSPDEQLLRLTTFKDPENVTRNVSMFLQLFMTLDNRMRNITSQQMLEISMVQNDIMFDEPPTCLIMQAPRDARGINCYDNVLPSRMIEISKLCVKFFKKCADCDKMAAWQCKVCLDRCKCIDGALFCDDHKCEDDNARVPLPDSSSCSMSHVKMHLKAIICIERAHFVSYVKENDFDNNWVFFDSMSTQNNSNNYSVPKVTLEGEVSEFLSLEEGSMAEMLEDHIPVALKRIVKDSYIFVYHNTSKTCY